MDSKAANIASSTLDGLHIGNLGPMTSGIPSDFIFDIDDVIFNQRVWERRIEEDRWQADLIIASLRGPCLTDGNALAAFLIKYHEWDASVHLKEFDYKPWSGFWGPTSIFWLLEPGWAVEIIDPWSQFSPNVLEMGARSIIPNPILGLRRHAR